MGKVGVAMEQIESRLSKVEDKVTKLETRVAVAESNIKDIKDDIKSIMSDTKWLRRTITGALIIATISGLVGLFFALLNGRL